MSQGVASSQKLDHIHDKKVEEEKANEELNNMNN